MSTPSTIQRLEGREWFDAYLCNFGKRFKSCQLSKLNRFRMVKSVSLPFRYEHNAAWIGQPLSRLRISNVSHSSTNQSDHKHWVSILQNIRVKELSLCPIRFGAFGGQDMQKQMDCLSNLISAAADIEFLEIGPSLCSGGRAAFHLFGGSFQRCNCDKIVSSLRNLRGLSLMNMNMSDFPDKLLQSVSYKMKSLHLSRNPFQQNASLSFPLCSQENVRYDALEELSMCEMDYPLISNIFATATKLKRIHWDIARSDMENGELRSLMQCIFERFVHLKYLCISPFSTDAAIAIKYLVEAIRQSKISREKFRLRIALRGLTELTHEHAQTELEGIAGLIGEIVATLDDTVKSDFVCSFEMSFQNSSHFQATRAKAKEMKFLIEPMHSVEICEEKKTNKFKYSLDKMQITITNEANTMNGYREKWLYAFD